MDAARASRGMLLMSDWQDHQDRGRPRATWRSTISAELGSDPLNSMLLHRVQLSDDSDHVCGGTSASGNTGGFGGVAIRPCPIRSVIGTLPPAFKDFYHTKMAHILVSVYSVFFQPHSTSSSKPIKINSIHIIDLVYTCIITSSDSSLAPSLSKL